MSRLIDDGMSRVRRSIASGDTMISPVQPSSFAAYSRTASSPRASMSASIAAATSRAWPDSVSGVLPAFFRYSTGIGTVLFGERTMLSHFARDVSAYPFTAPAVIAIDQMPLEERVQDHHRHRRDQAAAISSFHCTRYSPTMFATPTESTYIDESVVSTSAHTYEFQARRNVNSATAREPGPRERQDHAPKRLQHRRAVDRRRFVDLARNQRKKPISIQTENGSANERTRGSGRDRC